jgi:hypothetical protein
MIHGFDQIQILFWNYLCDDKNMEDFLWALYKKAGLEKGISMLALPGTVKAKLRKMVHPFILNNAIAVGNNRTLGEDAKKQTLSIIENEVELYQEVYAIVTGDERFQIQIREQDNAEDETKKGRKLILLADYRMDFENSSFCKLYKGTIVSFDGYHPTDENLYVIKTKDGITGLCPAKYLERYM